MNDLFKSDSVKKYYVAQKIGVIGAILKKSPLYIKALDNVTFTITKDRVLTIVGESGSGKTTLGKIITTLEYPTSGNTYFKGELVTRKNAQNIRKNFDMVFQNPSTSLNPRMRIKDIVSEALGKQDSNSAKEVIERVGLPYEEIKNKQPRELSGGQIQRIAISKTIAKQAELIVLDEPTSALDESIQAQILNLLVELQNEYKLTYVFITHNIFVAKYIGDEVLVLYAGKIAEYGQASQVLGNPFHPYTQLLISSVPSINSKELKPPDGDAPSLIDRPLGCSFHPRCPFVMNKCREEEPPLTKQGNSLVACWLYE
ncbi:MAG: ABC transporter ATP-binding protein [Thermoplasmatales archaeon]